MKSDNMKSGMQQAPARSLLNALGYTPEDIRKLSEYVRFITQDDNICVVGGEVQIEEAKELFDQVENLYMD